MANPCLKLIKGNNALETHFAGIEKLPIEQQREAILNKAQEYHEILYNELEALKITINPNHKVIKFSPDGKKETQVDEAEKEVEFKTESGAKLKGKLTTIKGFEGLDLVIVKNGMLTEVYELASGRPLASSNELTEEDAIAKQLSEIYPQGVPQALLLKKVVEDMLNPKAGEIKEEKPKAKQEEAEAPKAEPKQSKRKIRDEKIDAELDNAFKDLRDELGKLMSGINPELAIKAAKIIAIYTKAGVYKLADIIEDAYEKFGGISKEMFDAIKSGYASFRENADDETYSKLDENTRSFTYEILINKLKDNEQAEQPIEEKPITDTKPIELKTKAIESKTLNLGNDLENGIRFQLGDQKQEQFTEVIDGFYSPLEKIIIQAKQDKLPAKQWIDKFAKGEEAKFTGLTEWLSQQQGSVAKADILQYLKDNRIEIKEVKKTDRKLSDDRFDIDFKDGKFIVTRNGVEEKVFDNDSDANDYIANMEIKDESGTTKFSQFQLEGEAENYKEVLVTLPDTKKSAQTNVTNFFNRMKDKYGEGFVSKLTTEENAERLKLKEDLDNQPKNPEFKSSHFDEANILVHLRMNTRTDADGKKVLFLEEVQSDWGQEGKKNNFNETPTAPFVTNTNSWVKLGLKVAIKEAVAQGVDKIAWTTGEQQNERYDLSEQVDEIQYLKNNDETYLVRAIKDGQTIEHNPKLNDKELEAMLGKDVAQRIIQNEGLDIDVSHLGSTIKAKSLKGDQLSVGGKGMKGFYGSPTEGSLGIIGEVVKSLTKQEPKTTEFDANEKGWKDTKLFYDLKESLLFEKELEKQGKTGIISTVNPSGSYTIEWNEPRNSVQHSIEITPEVKASVEIGLPLFKANNKAQKAFETNDNTKATKENLQAEFPDAIVVQSESELPTSIQREIREQKADGKVQGVYHNGDVYLVADNIKTIGEATGTYRHETLGHKGVIDHLGEKLHAYATRIIDNAKGGQLRKLQELAAKYGLPTDLNSLTAEQKQLLGEEYIAMISENKSKYPQAWNDLVSFIRETLRKLGINLQVTIAEIQALIGKVESNSKAKNESKSTESKTRFNIVGENANFKNDFKDNLVIAKELEAKGTSKKEIWIATGWEKGIDGKWRAEIDNSKMELDPEFMQMRGYTLAEAIKYDELFELYPEIKDVRVSVIPNLGNMLGAYMPTKNLIMLNGARTIEEIRSTLLHEIQHIIQGKEGFATGGTSKMAETYLRNKISKISISKNIPTFLAKAANKLSSSLFQGVNINSSKEEFNAELNKAKDLLSKDVFDLYQSIAGEVESRNVQERMNMTKEEKAMTPLVETEDVSREEQIILMNNEKGAFFAENTNNKPLRLPQTIARQALDQIKEDIRNKVAKKDIINNAVALIQESDWYYDLDDTRKARVNNTTVKSLLENATKEINYLEDKVEEYKQKLIENKLTTREVFNDIVAFLQTNKIKGKITPTEVNRLIKAAVQITVKRDTSKALDDFMNLYEVIKEKALFRVDKNAREQAEVEFVTPIVESLVQSGYDLDAVLDYFETISQKRMAEILYHKEKSKLATEEERVNKAKETLDKQREDLRNATYISFRDWLKRNRLYWFNLMSDRSFVPATLMKKTGMEQSYYQFKNTNGYGHNAKEMYDKAFDKIWKTLTVKKVELLNDFIQMMRIIEIENNTSKVIQHPNNLSSLDAKSFLNDQKRKLGEKEFNDMQKRAREYFNVYQEILDLQLENGFISQETYDALNGKDYQPRLFIQHALNFDGELTLDQKSHLNGVKKGLGDNPVKNLDSGSANSLIYNAQWLLSNSISTLYQNIADNTLNKLLIEKELPKAQETFDELLTKPENELTIEEKTFIEYFTEFSEKVKTNEIIGFNSENNTPIYKYEVPDKYVAKYYWSDGVKHQFFIESELADQFDGKKGAFLNQKNQTAIQLLSLFTGVGILKYMATGNNPLFIVTNTPRDFSWTILVSEHYGSIDLFGKKIYGIPLMGTAQMTYQLFPSTYDFIKTKLGYENTDMSLFFQHGGSFEFLHKQGTIAKKSGTYRFIKKPLTSILGANMQPRVERYVDNNWMSKGITLANEWSEIAFRIATFRRSVNAQLKEWKVENESQIGDLIDENGIMLQTKKEILDEIYRKAANDAKSVLDYSQGGRLVKDLDLFLPYANVAAQSTRVYSDTMKKKPLVTTLKTFYNVAIPLATTLTLAMLFIAGDDDEPEEDKGKTAEIKYLEFIDGIPKETRNKYHLFPTKKRDEKGNRIAYKIAKDQFLIPYSSFAESIMLNVLRKRNSEHYKQIEAKTISKELATNIALHNLQFKTITDVPLVKASFAWIAGYDTYNNKQLDQYEKIEQLEGIGNPNVEDFYKHFGRELGISPIRAKTAIEAIITSPQSNPFLATGYEVMDYAFTDKSMEHLGKGVKEMLLKGLKNRTTTKSTEWTKAENILNESKSEQVHMALKEKATRQLFKDKAQEVIDGKTTAEEALGELRKQYESDPNYPSYMKSFRNKVRSSRTDVSDDGIMSKIKREKSPGAKAVMIRDIYGDINSPENAEIKKELLKKRVINGATMRYLERKTAN